MGLWDPDVGQLNQKLVLFAHDFQCLAPDRQKTFKTDLNAFNEHCIRCLTSFQIQVYRAGVGSVALK